MYITVPENVRETPKQTKVKEEIVKLKSQLLHLKSIDTSGISALNNCESEIVRIGNTIKSKEKELRRLGLQASYQRGFRVKKRNLVKKLSQNRFVFTRYFSWFKGAPRGDPRGKQVNFRSETIWEWLEK